MRAIETFEKNTFSLILTWTLADGTVKNMTGATMASFAKARNGDLITLTSVVLDGAAGQTRTTAAADTFPAGYYDVQVRATLDGVTRTYEKQVAVKASLAA